MSFQKQPVNLRPSGHGDDFGLSSGCDGGLSVGL